MTDKNLDPASLTAEERAIVDAVVLKSFPTFAPDWSYPLAIATCEPIILARRALFGEPAQEEDPGDACLCPACSPSRFGGEPAEWEPDLSKLAERIFREQPAPSPEMPEAVREAVEKLRRSGNYDRTADRLESFALMAFRPVSESPGAVVEQAVADLRLYAKDHIGTAGAAIWGRADALESWWRSQQEMTMQGMIDYQQATSDYYAMKRRVEELEAQPAPAPVRMTPALEFILKRADFAVLQDRDDDRVDEAYADELEKMIAAVRAPQYGLPSQAEKPQGVKLPKVRDALVYLQKAIAAANDGWAGAWASLRSSTTHEQIDAALAELDAAEGRKP